MGFCVFLPLVFALIASFSAADFGFGDRLTDIRDVAAINGLFVSLNFPPLNGWVAAGGDPCLEQWEGVDCVISNITSLNLSNKNLGGTLDNNLGLFASIIDIDLSNNHIAGTIPSELPPTLLNLYLKNNNLTEGIPDAFEQLTSLITLDLSGNNLTSQLPQSFRNLSSLESLHLQNNSLTGVLNVLQDIPLQDLNVENNEFSGPIPANLFKIPNFRKDGNPFNTTVIPSPPIPSPPFSAMPPTARSPESAKTPEKPGNSSAVETQKPENTSVSFTKKKFAVVPVLVGVVLVVVALCLSLAVFKKRHAKADVESNNVNAYKNGSEKPTKIQAEKDDRGPTLKDHFKPENKSLEVALKPRDEHEMNVNVMPLQPPHPPPVIPVNKGFASSAVHTEICARSSSVKSLKSPGSVRIFTIATLQQYTNSFSEENLLGKGTFGSVYKAELPDGKVLSVKKLNNMATRQQSDDEFLELVSSISKIRHANAVELVGYCNEHGQRLLVHEYCEIGTLHDALHLDNEVHSKLTWSARIRLALGAARALQYLHEVCQPSVIHRNFRSGNILLDDKLNARVSDCGLAHLLSPGYPSELAGRLLSSNGYAAPEFELGSYTDKSDIYSFGVVMLELLTGRKSFDKTRNRWEQSLVRWAIPRLHDIDSLSKMVDPTLNGAYTAKALSRFADIIARCVQSEPEFRPAMSEVVQDLLHMI